MLAKGMASYETLSEGWLGRPVLVLLTAKCDPVAREVGVPRGSPAAVWV